MRYVQTDIRLVHIATSDAARRISDAVSREITRSSFTLTEVAELAGIFSFAHVFLSELRLHLPTARDHRLVTRIAALLIAVVLLLPNRHFSDYGGGAQWTLKPGNQATQLIRYVQDNIQDGEFFFSFSSANYVVKYKNGCHTDTIGNASPNNIIWGSGLQLNASDSSEVSRVVNTHGAYVLFYNSYYPFSYDVFPSMITADLEKVGYMDLIMDDYYTPLYWFTQDISKVKAAATLTAPDLTATNGTISGNFVATNTGKTVLQSDGYGALSVAIRNAATGAQVASIPFGQSVQPGDSASVKVDIHDLPPGQYAADLVCQDEYSFSQLGMTPLTITVSATTG